MRKQAHVIIASALALLLGLVACSSGGSDDDSAGRERDRRVPAGYVDVRDAQMGFAVAVPQDWQQVPLNAEALKQQADAVRQQQPELAQGLESAQSLVGRGRLFAIHPDGTASVHLIVNDAQGATLEDIPGPTGAELRNRGAEVHSEERTRIGGEDAVKFTATFRGNPEAAVDVVQYYLVKQGKIFVLALTGRDPALDVIAGSLRLS